VTDLAGAISRQVRSAGRRRRSDRETVKETMISPGRGGEDEGEPELAVAGAAGGHGRWLRALVLGRWMEGAGDGEKYSTTQWGAGLCIQIGVWGICKKKEIGVWACLILCERPREIMRRKGRGFAIFFSRGNFWKGPAHMFDTLIVCACVYFEQQQGDIIFLFHGGRLLRI
jgi:hypothetical protein